VVVCCVCYVCLVEMMLMGGVQADDLCVIATKML
jgi:hypothetical protein